MHLDWSRLLTAAAVGVAASLFMDLWNLFLKRAFGIPSLDYRLLGRWIGHLPRGTFRHARIADAAEVPCERALGWAAHCGIGIVFAVALVATLPGDWLARPTLLPALAYGVATVVFPYFLLQPALGFGVASSKAPKPAQARLKSLATHTVFGLGLYLAARAATLLR